MSCLCPKLKIQTDSEESKIKELLTKEKNENNIKNTEDLNKSFEDMLLEKSKKINAYKRY